jgi:DNA-binding transcriptional MocR family regulator
MRLSRGATISGGNPAHASSSFVEKMLSSGALEKHIKEKLIPCYSARYHTMVEAIREHLVPLGVQISTAKPYAVTAVDGKDVILAGGFFLLITLPRGLAPVPTLAKISIDKHELKFAYGKMFEVKGDGGSKQRSDEGFGSSIRLCWAYHEEEAIVDGIKRMRDLLLQNKE